MRKLLVSVALTTAGLAAVPAAAQYHPAAWSQRGPARPAVNQLLQDLNRADRRIMRSAQRGIISPREATGLQREANRIRRHLARGSRNGLSGREFAALRVQVNQLEQRVRIERRDRDGRRW